MGLGTRQPLNMSRKRNKPNGRTDTDGERGELEKRENERGRRVKMKRMNDRALYSCVCVENDRTCLMRVCACVMISV